MVLTFNVDIFRGTKVKFDNVCARRKTLEMVNQVLRYIPSHQVPAGENAKIYTDNDRRTSPLLTLRTRDEHVSCRTMAYHDI